MKKAAHSGQQARLRSVNFTIRPLSKIARILAHLLTGSSLNRFEAERLGDHCLNSTVSTLTNRYGLTFKRRPERVQNNWGTPCSVNRYSLPESEFDRARDLMEYFSLVTN
tara:strand:- start:13619 stop:13948 length:330 start_codon:yes stop_codon:yes gene_type:complete